MAKWNTSQEELILKALQGSLKKQKKAPKTTTELIADLRATSKFPSTRYTERSLLSKSKNISTEALSQGILALMPEKPKPEPKPTAKEKRQEIFSAAPKMNAQQQKKYQALIDAAKEEMEARAKAREKAAATRAKRKAGNS